ncbi:MAG: hypothetical protein NDJ90_11315 [Oligoflexia bacterium]|nr:hypothetical protein [Oligoflexia bacterium]
MRTATFAALVMLPLSLLSSSFLAEKTLAAGKRQPASDASDTTDAGTTAPVLHDAPATDEPLEYKEMIWNVQEGAADQPAEAQLVWKAERGMNELTMSRIPTVESEEDSRTIQLSEKEELTLREKVSELALNLPSTPPRAKNECPHWIDIETTYGRRLYCNTLNNAKDSRAAVEFVALLNRMMGTRPFPVQ